MNITSITYDVSSEVKDLILTVNIVYINSFVSLFGICANVVNMRVFLIQGFRENVTISLFLLAISDLGSLTTVLMFSVCNGLIFYGLGGLPFEPADFENVVAAFPRGTFSRITSSITAFIALERCLCVIMPIKVKAIITTTVTAIFLSAISLALLLTLVPVFLTLSLGWKFDGQKNITILAMIPTAFAGQVDINAVLSIHTIVQMTSFFAIIILTVVLIVALKQQSKWRQATTSGQNLVHQNINMKLEKTVKMVVTMAITYTLCYSPGIAVLLAGFSEPDFNIFGSLVNSFLILTSFSLLTESVNSAITIVLYYFMSAKFRNTFCQLECVAYLRKFWNYPGK